VFTVVGLRWTVEEGP